MSHALLAALLFAGPVAPGEPDPPAAPGETTGAVEVTGRLTAGFPLTFTLVGPEVLSETGDPDPFTDYTFTGTFATKSPLGLAERTSVTEAPGYFAADGDAANSGAASGDRWRVHFRVPPGAIVGPGSPLEYALTLKRGEKVVARRAGQLPGPGAGGRLELRDGVEVRPADPPAPPAALLARDGRLWRAGAPFYKTGAGSPENLLAFADFDGTWSLKGEPREGESHSTAPHRYAPHLADWNPGDPTWGDGRGKGLIGALNYLAGAGANSLYFLPFNVAGDGRDVWPHASPDDRTRFDCSKLDQWNAVFDHCDKLGIALHMLLTETENESLFENRDGGGGGPVPFADTRKLYYRELIARFGHHPAVIWNLGEENGPEGEDKSGPDGRGNTDAQRLAFAAYIKKLDPYAHPVVVHTYPNQQEAVYTPLLGSPHFDGASLQLSPMGKTREETLKWRARSAAAGRPWFVALDEVGPANTGVMPDDADGAADNHRDVRRALWANLLSGGSGAEWYFGYKYHDNDLNLEDFRSRAEVWAFSKLAREFAERENLHEYEPAPGLFEAEKVVAARRPAGGGATDGGALLIYIPAGRDPAVPLPAGEHAVRWFDPQSGGEWRTGSAPTVAGPGEEVPLGDPPGGDRSRDWVAKVGGE